MKTNWHLILLIWFLYPKTKTSVINLPFIPLAIPILVFDYSYW